MGPARAPANTTTTTLKDAVAGRDLQALLALTHCSPVPIATIRDTPDDQVDIVGHVANKPRGLWLALGDDWLACSLRYDARFRKEHFGRQALTDGSGYHMYKVGVQPQATVLWAPGADLRGPAYADCLAGRYRAHLLVLMGADAAREFHRRYRTEHHKHTPHKERVDWARVAQHFAGVYVLATDFHDDAHKDMTWFRAWELRSACVWRPSALRVTLQELPASQVRAAVRRCKQLLALAA